MRSLSLLTLSCALAAACGGSASTLPPPDPLQGDAQTPPTADQAALDTWLAGGAYKAWACEGTAHEARAGSGHSRNRICTNTLQSTHSSTAAFPKGSAAVKELIDDGGIVIGYAVYVRADVGDGGEKRFWYEIINDSVVAIGYGHTTCTGCHGDAPKDYVFTQVR